MNCGQKQCNWKEKVAELLQRMERQLREYQVKNNYDPYIIMVS